MRIKKTFCSVICLIATIVVVYILASQARRTTYHTESNLAIQRDCERRKTEYEKRANVEKLNSTVWNNVECMLLFIGHGRSGTSLVGSLLDAHPHVIVANEYDVIKKWAGYRKQEKTRENMFQELYTKSIKDAGSGNRMPLKCRLNEGEIHSYYVPNQWQGRFDKFIKVIGDKKGETFTKDLLWKHKTDKKGVILPSIQRAIKVPLKFIYVLRNPLDIAATRMFRGYRRGIKLTDRDKFYEKPLIYPRYVQLQKVTNLVKLIKATINFTKRPGIESIIMHNDELIKNPRRELKRLCDFLSVACSEDYLNDCAGIVFTSPSQTRNTMIWDSDARNIIMKEIMEEPLLQRYRSTNMNK